ncbi:hypothetical protein [Albidovulum salinarum]|nr:hypothetical protein [Defluviimonas sp. WL0024]
MEKRRKADKEKLRGMEQQAVQRGMKVVKLDRLKAAFHLTRAWKRANEAGLRKEDFQDAVLSRLKRPHAKRQEFRLANWTLRRGEDPTTQPQLPEIYKNSPTPQKSLEPYLVGLAVAAEQCGEDPDDWKLDMMRDLSIWSRAVTPTDIAPPDDRPAETLEILLKALCAELAQRNRLDETFAAICRMNCRWDMFCERLVATDVACMQRIESPISPAYEVSLYFEEMFPFPSIPLLRVPYFVGKAEFLLAPEDVLRAQDENYLASGDYWPVGTAIKGNGGRHYCIPADAPDSRSANGTLAWYREIRLCIAPDGHGGYTSALESRPYVAVRFDADLPFGGRHHVVGGYELDLERGMFYGRDDDGGPVWPHIRMASGESWRITLPKRPDGSLPFAEWTERNPDTTGWYFEADPVLHAGEVGSEPWYLSYTPASAPYVRLWLTEDWRLADEPADNPWSRGNFDWDDLESRWNRDLPPIHELNFPDFSHATWIECCLHNGLIEEALQASIDRLKEQTGRLQADWHAARERHADALLRRWTTKSEEKDIQK